MDSHDPSAFQRPAPGSAGGLKRLLTGGAGSRWRDRDPSVVGWLLTVAAIVVTGYLIARLLNVIL